MATQRDMDAYDEWADADMGASGARDSHVGDSYGWATADDLVNSIIGAGESAYQQAQPQEQQPHAHGHQPEGDEVPPMAPKNLQDQGVLERHLPQEQVVASPIAGNRLGGAQSEYGAWSYQHGASSPFGREGTPEHDRGPASEKEPSEDATRRPDPHERRDRNGEHLATAHFDDGDKAGRKGRFTSILALAFAAVAVVAALSPVLLTVADQNRWILALVGSLPMTAMCAVPALLLGLRSAVKPKEQLGKRRGIVAIVVCAVALAVSAVLVTTKIKGMMDEMNMNGVIAKEQTGTSSMVIVFPGGKLELGNEAIKVLMKAGVLPDSTLDNGAIPISSQNGKVYVGSREIDTEVIRQYSSYVSPESSQQTLREIVKGIETLSKHNFAITTDGESITLRNKNGKDEGYTITWDELVQKSAASSTGSEQGASESSEPEQSQGQSQEQSQGNGSQLAETVTQAQQVELTTGMPQAQPVMDMSL